MTYRSGILRPVSKVYLPDAVNKQDVGIERAGDSPALW